jgi:hypothetical protein
MTTDLIPSDNRESLQSFEDAVVNHGVIGDENFIASRPSGDFGVKSLIALSLALYDGLWPVAGEPTHVAAFSVSLTDAATNYVQMSDAGIISVTTSPPSGWPARLGIFTALYDFTFAAGVLTGWNDWRVGASVAAISLGQVLSALGIDNWVVTGSGPYSITITKGAYSAQIDLT